VKANNEVAVEATGNTRLFCEALKDQECRLVVVNPHHFQVISRSVKKTDEYDAKVLAEFLAKGMLPEVRMKDEMHARVASLGRCGHAAPYSCMRKRGKPAGGSGFIQRFAGSSPHFSDRIRHT